MPLKKSSLNNEEIPIYDEALIYKRGEYWQMRMWLSKEGKYARFSLRTRNKDTALDKAKKYYHELMAKQLAGKTYFSLTAKQGVEEYLKQRAKDVEIGQIVKGRLGTIKTHLEHWLKFIGKDAKLKEMERTDCENYFYERTKTKNKRTIPVSVTTIQNEQSTVNAMMSWLHKRGESYIDSFDFKKLPKVDKGDEANRRNTFTDDEIVKIKTELESYISEGMADLSINGSLSKVITGYYLLISIITGLRRGEQLQLTWGDIDWSEKYVEDDSEAPYNLVKITVRAKTTKVRKTRNFVVVDWEYFRNLYTFQKTRGMAISKNKNDKITLVNSLIFSVNGKNPITPRVIGYHFDEIIKRCDIENPELRNLVPYSFRHYFITDRVNRGYSPTQVAETCGTSTQQIEKTYYHTTERKMIENALPNYYYRDDLLIPKP
ncbi:MAG: tyrosine-type recombinase/integrase [Betaproteobacteria bacterium]|nr:tyrosine-type recombinase/integrase [Betaproteobacteria bacterium]MDE2056964.1 tyrosine-type recombinase/integrase [Betaproteobacteria bacterium]